jgi:hypothetical protein
MESDEEKPCQAGKLHHGAIRKILNIKWNQVKEDHIKNQRD